MYYLHILSVIYSIIFYMAVREENFTYASIPVTVAMNSSGTHGFVRKWTPVLVRLFLAIPESQVSLNHVEVREAYSALSWC